MFKNKIAIIDPRIELNKEINIPLFIIILIKSVLEKPKDFKIAKLFILLSMINLIEIKILKIDRISIDSITK